MFFHVILTTKCNLECRYCHDEAMADMDDDITDMENVDYTLPEKISYDISLLGRFCGQDPDCTLIFYGGEPLLCTDEIEQIMDTVKVKHFVIQTNGLFLDKLKPEYVNRFHTILVSIDGDRELTDFYRGKGTFGRIVNNLRLITQNGFEGELTARMTVMEQTDIYKQVMWLLNNHDFSFSSVHWQLNAGFWNDFERRDFRRWSEESYNPGVRKIVKSWVDHMEGNETVLRLYPLLGITRSLLSGEEANLLRCGAGWANYAVQTDGHITPCPSMWGMKNYYVGHIETASPLKLKRVVVGKPCTECDIFNLCGGRCLYVNVTNRWNTEAYTSVCNTVRSLMKAIIEECPRIEELINKGKVSLKDFEFMKYNGCEIIP